MDQLYKSYADIPSLEQQTGKILAMFDQVEAGMEKLSSFGLKINTAGSVKQVDDLTKEYTNLGINIDKQKKQIADMAVKLASLTTEEAKHIETLRQTTALVKGLTAEQIKAEKLRQGEYVALKEAQQANTELNKSITLRLKLRQAEEGSINQLNLRYQKLSGILNKLSEDQRNTARGQALIKNAGDLKIKINELQKSMGNFSANVGRYAESLGGLFETVRSEIAKVRAQKEELEQRTVVQGFVTPQQQQDLDKFTATLGELNNVMAIADKTGNNYQQTVRQIGFQLSNLSASGNQSQEFLDDFKKGVADSKKEAKDLRQEINALASDTRQLDLAVGSISVFASGFEAAAGAMALFGKNTDDVQRITQKLVAIQSIANGIREVGEQITRRGTAANKAYNFVMQQGTILFGKGSTAAQRFNAALKGIIILALIAGIVALVKQMNIFGDTAEDMKENTDALNDSLKDLNDTINEQISLIGRAESDNLRLLRAELSAAEARGASAKELFGIKKKIASEELKISQDQFQASLDRAEADEINAGSGLEGEEALIHARERYIELYDQSLEQIRKFTKERSALLNVGKDKDDADVKQLEDLIEFQKRERDLYKEKVDTYTNGAQNLLDAQTNFDNLRLAEQKRQQDAEKEAALELFKFRKQLVIDQKNELANPDLAPVIDVNAQVAAAKESAQAQKDIIDAQLKYDLSQNDLANSQRVLLKEKAAQEIYDIEYNLSKQVADLFVADVRRRKQDEDEAIRLTEEMIAADIEAKAQARAKAFEIDQANIEKYKNEELQQNAENFTNGLKTEEAYNKRKEEIELNYQRRILQSQITFYEGELKLLQDSGEDTTKALQAIADAKAQLAELNVGTVKKSTEEEKAAIDALKQKYTELGEAIQNAFQAGIAGVFERQKNAIQDLIDENDRLKEAEIARITRTTEAEETKAAKIKIVESAAAARKEALERRQRAIDRQKAIFDRGSKIFEIVTDNITAVNKIKVAAAAAVNPVVKALLLSQIPVTLAIGAAGLLALLATPIPKYRTGTESSVGGFAEVAEEGRELGVEPTGKLKLFEKHSVVKLMKGTKIFTNRVTEDIIASANNGLMHPSIVVEANESANDRSEDILWELRELNKKPVANYNIQQGIEMTSWYNKNFKN